MDSIFFEMAAGVSPPFLNQKSDQESPDRAKADVSTVGVPGEREIGYQVDEHLLVAVGPRSA